MVVRVECSAAAAVVFIVTMPLQLALQIDPATALVNLLLLERQIGLIVVIVTIQGCVLHILTLIDKIECRLLICCFDFGYAPRLWSPEDILQVPLLERLLDVVFC